MLTVNKRTANRLLEAENVATRKLFDIIRETKVEVAEVKENQAPKPSQPLMGASCVMFSAANAASEEHKKNMGIKLTAAFKEIREQAEQYCTDPEIRQAREQEINSAYATADGAFKAARTSTNFSDVLSTARCALTTIRNKMPKPEPKVESRQSPTSVVMSENMNSLLVMPPVKTQPLAKEIRIPCYRRCI